MAAASSVALSSLKNPAMDVSSRSTFSGLALPPRGSSGSAKRSKSLLVQASSTSGEQQAARSNAGRMAAALAAAAIIGSAPIVAAPPEAAADVAGLTKCKDSAAFAKREKKEIKKLQSRLKLYADDSAPALAINATIEKTKRRFKFYGDAGLLCGADGLPHLIVDGDQQHLGEFVYPGLIFLYIAGWIGWVGRSYLIAVSTEAKPTQKEIIIDVPLATSLIWKGFVWPLAAVSEFRNGKLVVDAANITVSPR
ncbi:photosystem I reaction center subunit III [Selaginella moellendorffii]|nr:photosystem I reaction center subunit III [Selaginella moellendorffii]|eukprot:XP_002983887.2 photosystem I reaction center subunit III [Selaginella moellendorffii]